MLRLFKIRRCASIARLFFVCNLSFLPALAMAGDRDEMVHRVVFYNCENLFDPSDDPATQDDEFTPQGSRHWTYSRQYSKMLNLAKALLVAGGGKVPSLVGLAEVENDSMVSRLATSSPLRRWNYSYVMTHSRDVRGINVALMYQSLDFRLLGSESIEIPVPSGSRPTRALLHAWGRLWGGDTLDVVVCHLPSRLGGVASTNGIRTAAHLQIRQLCDSLERIRLRPYVLVMGDMNDYPNTRSLKRDMNFGRSLVNLMEPLQRQLDFGRRSIGSHKYDGKWGFLDQFWVNTGLSANHVESAPRPTRVWVDSVDVACMPFMLVEDAAHLGHRPFRSYYGYKYEGGFSDHLPILLDLHIAIE